jgi:TrmH family RNA methyltransferase
MNFKPYKKEFEHSYSIGVYPTLELLNYRAESVIKVILSSKSDTNEGVFKILSFCEEHNIPTEFDNNLIIKLGGHGNSYAVGVFNKYATQLDIDSNHLMLVNPSDAGNLGTICRTMIAFNFKNLALISPAVDIFDPKVIRASMGAVFGINFSYMDNFGIYKNEYARSLYTFTTQGKVILKDAQFTKPYTLIFGSEGPGLSQEYLNAGTSVQIPQSDKVDSLNLAVSVGIVLAQTF